VLVVYPFVADENVGVMQARDLTTGR